jgi:hypothetical protein
MPTTRSPRWALARGTLGLLLAGCALGLPEGDDSYPSPGHGSGYVGSSGYTGVRSEHRGTLPSGSYTERCRDTRLDQDRRELEAECRRLDGRWSQTSLALHECDRNIVNNNGRLECPRQQLAKLPPGSYRESCRDIAVEGRRLSARCRRRNGEWRDTQLDTTRCRSPIGNDEGRLTCG